MAAIDTGRIDTVREHEDDAPALLMEERRHADAHGIPQRRRTGLLQLGSQNLEQLVPVAGETPRVHLDPVGEAADARLVAPQEPHHELLGGRLHETEVRDLAAAAIQHHDDHDGLEVVREDGDLLALPVVVDLEVVPSEIRHEPTVVGRDGRIHRHGSRAGAEGRRLLGRERDGEREYDGEGGDDDARGSEAHRSSSHGTKRCRARRGGSRDGFTIQSLRPPRQTAARARGPAGASEGRLVRTWPSVPEPRHAVTSRGRRMAPGASVQIA